MPEFSDHSKSQPLREVLITGGRKLGQITTGQVRGLTRTTAVYSRLQQADCSENVAAFCGGRALGCIRLRWDVVSKIFKQKTPASTCNNDCSMRFNTPLGTRGMQLISDHTDRNGTFSSPLPITLTLAAIITLTLATLLLNLTLNLNPKPNLTSQ